MNDLFDKVAIVAGASSGIGYATALLFAREGARVVVAARSQVGLDELVDVIRNGGGQAIACAGDVTDEGFARALVDTAVGEFGGLDVAVNNAGTLGHMGPTPEVTRQSWHDTLDVNLTSAFLAAKYQLPAMLARGAGSLVFTSTFVGHTAGFPGLASYAASKSGLIGLTQALATEFGSRNIRVNAILPGATDTPMFRAMNSSIESRAFIASLNTFKRIASPDEIARSMLYLASDASSFVTGTALLVDGGVSINRT